MKKTAIFGIPEVAQQALAERLLAAPGPGCRDAGDDAARAEHLDPDPRQVDRAGELEHVEPDLGGPEQGRDPERGRHRPDRQPDRDAEGRETPERRPPTRAFFVTIAVSGPGITISRIEIARKGSRATCTGRSMPTAPDDSESESHSMVESRHAPPPRALPCRGRAAGQLRTAGSPAAAPGRRRREHLGQHRRAARREPRAGAQHHRRPRRPIRTATSRRPPTRGRSPARRSRS